MIAAVPSAGVSRNPVRYGTASLRDNQGHIGDQDWSGLPMGRKWEHTTVPCEIPKFVPSYTGEVKLTRHHSQLTAAHSLSAYWHHQGLTLPLRAKSCSSARRY